MNRLEEENGDLEHSLESLMRERNEQSNMIDSLNEQMATLEQQLRSAGGGGDSLSAALSEHNAQANDQLRSSLEQEQTARAAAETQLSLARHKLDEAQRQLAAQTQSLSSLRSELDSVKTADSGHQVLLKELEAKLAALTSQLAQLTAQRAADKATWEGRERELTAQRDLERQRAAEEKKRFEQQIRDLERANTRLVTERDTDRAEHERLLALERARLRDMEAVLQQERAAHAKDRDRLQALLLQREKERDDALLRASAAESAAAKQQTRSEAVPVATPAAAIVAAPVPTVDRGVQCDLSSEDHARELSELRDRHSQQSKQLQDELDRARDALRDRDRQLAAERLEADDRAKGMQGVIDGLHVERDRLLTRIAELEAALAAALRSLAEQQQAAADQAAAVERERQAALQKQQEQEQKDRERELALKQQTEQELLLAEQKLKSQEAAAPQLPQWPVHAVKSDLTESRHRLEQGDQEELTAFARYFNGVLNSDSELHEVCLC